MPTAQDNDMRQVLNVLGIIPARGGSKGVIGKNTRLVAGEPLIAYSIQAAQASRSLTYFLTTTDDERIAEVAERYGSPVLRRPADLAQDDTPMVPVVLHALDQAEKATERFYDLVVLLQPTSPIREGSDIDAVIHMFEGEPELEGVISVCAMDDAHPARMYHLDEAGWMEPLWSEWETARRQDLPVVYYRNGAIYAIRRSTLVEQRTLMSRRKKAYVMPVERLANIDDERDLVITEALVKLWKAGQL
jgi:CMP-N-acetylneuraminic acid synthetase